MKAVAIIPARGGSKGIPGKNIQIVCGKPLIQWMIEAAQKAELVDDVYVTTDSQIIAQVAADCGAEVIERPSSLATDTSPSEFSIIHAIESGARGDVTVFLQCTSPLTLPEDIDGCIRKIIRGWDSCFTATPFHHYLWQEDKDVVKAVDHDPTNRLMRQQKEKRLLEVGAVYALNTQVFMNEKTRFCGKVTTYEIPKSRALEIDDTEDLELAQFYLERRVRACTSDM